MVFTEGPKSEGSVDAVRPDQNSIKGTFKNCDISSQDCKTLRINIGVVSRLIKEHTYYIKDSEKLLAQVDAMRESSRCSHEVKQISEVYAESMKMIPQVLSQLRTGRDKLFHLLETTENDPFQVILEGRSVLEDANRVLQDTPCVVTFTEHEQDSDVSEY